MSKPDPGKEREAEASTANAEAGAAKAKADAEKAQADARAAEAAARKAEQEVADHDAASAVQQRDAEAKKKAAEANRDAAAARRAQITALIPDLTGVKESTLEGKEGPPLWSSFLLGRAVQAAAESVAGRIKLSQNGAARILVTSDPELASADAIYHDVTTGLKELVTAADNLLQRTTPETVEVAAFTPIDAIGAVASAVPSVLSLLTAHRSLSTSAVTATDLAAAAAVAGSLRLATPAATIVHDGFRLVPAGEVYALAGTVATKRQQLIARKIELSDKKSQIEPDYKQAKVEVALLKAQPATPERARQLEDTEKRVHVLRQELDEIELRTGLIDSLVTAIDAFTAAARAIPSDGRRSALASAALHQELHGGTTRLTHVLLVKAQSGQAQQMLDNQPLWWPDKFSTAVDASITYILIDAASSAILAAGTASAIRSAHGKVGEGPTIEDS